MKRVDWVDLPVRLKNLIEVKTGPVTSSATVKEGDNSELAAIVETNTDMFFVKGLRLHHPGAVTQAREATVGPYVQAISPRLLWRIQSGGWDVNGFEYVGGRHADYAVDSADLPTISNLMRQLSELDCPNLSDLKRAENRWQNYLDDPADAVQFAGPVLLHTDWNPENVLIGNDGARLIDWAWPTLGAAWVDPACWILRLIVAGHDAESAECWAGTVPAWHTATANQLDMFAVANARLWNEIAMMSDAKPFRLCMKAASRMWAEHRTGGRDAEGI